MGNHRFRLSDMMPNAWFYKLKDMSSRSHGAQHSMRRSHKSRTAAASPTAPYKLSPSSHPPPTSCQSFIPNRASYYFPRGSETEKFPISPKPQDTHPPVDCPKSKRRSRRKPTNPSTKLVSSSVFAGCSCRAWEPESMTEHEAVYFTNDPGVPIIPDLEGRSINCDCIIASSAGEVEKLEDFDLVSELELPRIITKPGQSKSDEKAEKTGRSPARRYPHRVRVRGSSPRIIRNKKTNSAHVKRSTAGMSESYAVVKRSSDPQRDFRDSMVEMIVENNILTSRDLEELLACYLTLNSSEYHDVIVKVFEQIWFDLTDIIKL